MKTNENNAFNAIKNGKAFKPQDTFLFLGSALFIAVLFLALVIFPTKKEAEGFAAYKNGNLLFTYAYGSDYAKIGTEYTENVFFDYSAKTVELRFGDEINILRYDDETKTVRVAKANCSGKDCTRVLLKSGDAGAIFCAPHGLKIVLTTGDDSPIIG